MTSLVRRERPASYALGLAAGRPRPAGILALSGFIPTVDGWRRPGLASRTGPPAFIAHGRRDPIMEVGFAHQARALLESGGLEVACHESGGGHAIDPAHLVAARVWLDRVLPSAAS